MREAIIEDIFCSKRLVLENIKIYNLITKSYIKHGALRFKALINKKYTVVFFIQFSLSDFEIKDGFNYVVKKISLEDSEIVLDNSFHGFTKDSLLNYSELNGFSLSIQTGVLNASVIQSLHYDLTEEDLNNLRNQQEVKQEEVKIEPKEANGILKHFNYSHLPESLQEISKPVCELAKDMNNKLPDCAEKQAGLRKLLEAKDCFVRANLEKKR